MKKKISGALAVLALAIAVTFNVNINSSNGKLPSVSIDNIEALGDESGGVINCSGAGKECAKNSMGSIMYKS